MACERLLELFQKETKSQALEYPKKAQERGEMAWTLGKESSAIFFLIIEIREWVWFHLAVQIEIYLNI